MVLCVFFFFFQRGDGIRGLVRSRGLGSVYKGQDSGPNPEFVDFKRRLWITAPLAAAIFVLEMGSHIGLPFANWIGHTAFGWVQFLLATPVVLITWPFFRT